MKLWPILVSSIVVLGLPTPGHAGGLVLTGHDPDFHGHPLATQNVVGARNFLRNAVTWVSAGRPDPRILLVTCSLDGGVDHRDTRATLPVCGYPSFDVADHGGGAPGHLDLATVSLDAYDVLVIASDHGGSLRQDELDILNARAGDIASFLECGGGIVALSQSGDGGALTTRDRHGFSPFPVTSANHMLGPLAPVVTPDGLAMGFSPGDVTGNEAHAHFLNTGGMTIVDLDESGRIRTLAAWITETEPTVVSGVGMDRLWPPNHAMVDVGHRVETISCGWSPPPRVSVHANEDDEMRTGDGAHAPDAEREPSGVLRLRAERRGDGPGRIYVIAAVVDDGRGHVGHDCSVVGVPHDLGKAAMAWLDVNMGAALEYCVDHGGEAPPGFVEVGE